MRHFILSLLSVFFTLTLFAQNNVGIGVLDPASRLHINNNGDAYTALQMTNNSTGIGSFDGLTFQLSNSGNAYIILGESRGLSLGTAGNKNINILPNGDIGFNTQTMLGAADFTLHSQNNSGFGGMYINSPDNAGGKPFYGYAVNDSPLAWHYYDASTLSWRLFVGGVRMTVQNNGNVGIGTTSPKASAILELEATNKGFLPPRMTTTQRTAISSPAEGLMVYDSTLSKTYVYGDSEWNTLGGNGLWTENNSPVGVSYELGNVGIGSPVINSQRLYINSGPTNKHTATFVSTYTGTGVTFGVHSTVEGTGSGARFGVYGVGIAPGGLLAPAYGVFGKGEANGISTVYGLYGLAIGTGTGTRYGLYSKATGSGNYGLYSVADTSGYAGYFKGEVRVGDGNGPDAKIRLDPDGFSSAGVIDLFDDDGTKTIMIRANQSTIQGAEIIMTNDLGFSTVELDAEWDVQGGGYLGLKDDAANERVAIYANESATTGGAIYIDDVDGTNTVVIRANQSATEGAEMLMTNKTGQNTVEIDADWGVQGGGYLGLMDDAADDRVRLYASENTTTGAAIYLDDVGGQNTVVIRANQNASEGAEMIMTNKAGQNTIEIDADWDDQGGGYMSIEDDASVQRIVLYANEVVGQGAALYLFNNADTRTIELDADYGGKGRVITQELEITGGSDLAEYFNSNDGSAEILPGQVVSIDPAYPGNICLSNKANDTKVIGIVSGANGISAGLFMGQKESIAFGNVPVAIAGRVYVKVDESKFIVRPGDFLTSSSVPGTAMRIKNMRKSRGAILGKALTASDENGYVLILVNLQ